MTDESGRISSDLEENETTEKRRRPGPGQKELSPVHGQRTKAFGCDMCEASFGSRMELEEHLNSHSGDRPFECPECNAKFNRRSTLWNHRRIHSDTKPFECPVCGMQFKWKNSLKCHKEMHLRKNEHGEVGEQALRESLIPKRRGKYQQRARKKFLGENLPDEDATLSIDNERNSSSSTGQSDSRPSSTTNAASNLAIICNNNNNNGASLLHSVLQRQQQELSSAAMYSAAVQSVVNQHGHSPRMAASAPIGSQYSPSDSAMVFGAANSVMRHLPVITGIPGAGIPGMGIPGTGISANQLPFAQNNPVFSGSFATPYPMPLPHLPGPMNCFQRIFGNPSSDYTPNMDTYTFDPQSGGYIVKELPFDKW